ncbi:MAG: CHAD domain-containing protein [Pseudomonadota bacterium]
MPREIEIKLGLPPDAAVRVRDHPLLQGPAEPDRRLVSTYYDTPDLRLYRRGIALRVRETGAGQVQTVKCAGTCAGGLSDRPEWEQPWSGAFDFSAIDDARTARRLRAAAPHLAPAFVTDFRREMRVIRRDGATIRAMLDQGAIRAGGAEEPLCELELELEAGRPGDLLRLALSLSDTLPLWPEERSKAERGYRLWRGADLPVPDAGLAATMPAGAAFRQLAGGAVHAWQAGVRLAGTDAVEGVHQVRVALRRLRSLLRLFAPVLPAEFTAGWRRRLGDSARALGATRELDVLCDELLAPAAGEVAEAAWTAALLVLDAERRDARARAEAALAPDRQGRLILEFLAAATELAEADGSTDLAALAAQRMDRLRRRLRRRARALPAADAAAWHALRIAAKRLRYGLDFFAPLWPRKAVAEYRRRLARIQRRLGRVQDLEAARLRLEQLASEHPECEVVQCWLARHYRKRAAKWCREALQEVRGLLAQPRPWRSRH